MKKIGIFSGTFDPVHHGHVAFARQAAATAGLDMVYFLVEPEPRRKTGVSSLRHRLNMAWLAVQSHPEIDLLLLDQPQFSVRDTLPVLQQRFPDAALYMLLGTDLFTSLPHWQDFATLKRHVAFIVGKRSGQEIPPVTGINYSVVATEHAQVAASAVRSAWQTGGLDMVPDLVGQYIVANQLYMSNGAGAS